MVAVSIPSFFALGDKDLMVSEEMSLMYDSPALILFTLDSSLSIAHTLNPAEANAIARGNPTYPAPMTEI